MAQVHGQAAARLAAGDAGADAKGERRERHEHELQRVGQHVGERGARLDGVDQLRGDEGDRHLHDDLAGDDDRRGDRGPLELADAGADGADDLAAREPLLLFFLLHVTPFDKGSL